VFLTPHILLASERGKEFIDGAEMAPPKMGVGHGLDGFQLLCWICSQVDFSSLHLRVPEPQ
jgi:hypothetical protein